MYRFPFPEKLFHCRVLLKCGVRATIGYCKTNKYCQPDYFSSFTNRQTSYRANANSIWTNMHRQTIKYSLERGGGAKVKPRVLFIQRDFLSQSITVHIFVLLSLPGKGNCWTWPFTEFEHKRKTKCQNNCIIFTYNNIKKYAIILHVFIYTAYVFQEQIEHIENICILSTVQ